MEAIATRVDATTTSNKKLLVAAIFATSSKENMQKKCQKEEGWDCCQEFKESLGR